MKKQADFKEPSKEDKESESRPFRCLTIWLDAAETGRLSKKAFRKMTSRWRKEYQESSGKILFGAVLKESE